MFSDMVWGSSFLKCRMFMLGVLVMLSWFFFVIDR